MLQSARIECSKRPVSVSACASESVMAGGALSGETGRRMPRQKVVRHYEALFRGEPPPPPPQDTPHWHQLLLLRPHVASLTAEVRRLSREQLHSLAGSLRVMTARCVDAVCQQHMIRCVHALQTLSALVMAVGRQFSSAAPTAEVAAGPRLPPLGPPLSLMLVTEDEQQLPRLLRRCAQLLDSAELPQQVAALVLELLLALVVCDVACGEQTFENSRVLAAMMVDDGVLLSPLLRLPSEPATRALHGPHCLLLLTLLLGCNKTAVACNPYVVRVSVLDDELALNSLGQVMTAALADFNWRHGSSDGSPAATANSEPAAGGSGWLSSIASAVGTVFGGASTSSTVQQQQAELMAKEIAAVHAALLAVYEAVHLNRHFAATLTQAATDAASQPPSPLNSLQRGTAPPVAAAVPPAPPQQPVNLLASLIEHCSLVMQHSGGTVAPASHSCRLCFTVLTCVVEDQYCSSLLHDPNLVFGVRVHRLPMRHRRAVAACSSPQCLAVATLDLCVEFVVSHLSRRLPLELHVQCVGVVRRLLCYQKRQHVRLDYRWSQLWTALVALLRFIAAHVDGGGSKCQTDVDVSADTAATNDGDMRTGMLSLAVSVVDIFNLFITFGDTFLPTPACYDQLYYELIRVAQVFGDVYAAALRHAGAGGETARRATQLATALANIRAICHHFAPKIELWMQSTQQASPSEQQVLDVVRDNYESLTLKLQDGLDQYTRYSETHSEVLFLRRVARGVLQRTACSLQPTCIDHNQLVQQLSQIT